MDDLIRDIEVILAEQRNILIPGADQDLKEIANSLRDGYNDNAVRCSRIIVERYLKYSYAKTIGKDVEKLGFMSLDSMIQSLKQSMPKSREGSLRTLQQIQNYYSHAQEDTTPVSVRTLKGVINLVLELIESYHDNGIEGDLKQELNDTRKLLKEKGQLILALDVGTNKIATALVAVDQHNNATILNKSRSLHNEIQNASGILGKIEILSQSMLAQNNLEFKDLAGIGIGLPGQVDFKTGMLKHAPGLRLSNISVATRLRSSLGVPVFVDNDVINPAIKYIN